MNSRDLFCLAHARMKRAQDEYVNALYFSDRAGDVVQAYRRRAAAEKALKKAEKRMLADLKSWLPDDKVLETSL